MDIDTPLIELKNNAMLYNFKTAGFDVQYSRLTSLIERRKKFLSINKERLEKKGLLEHYEAKSIKLKNIQENIKAIISDINSWNNEG